MPTTLRVPIPHAFDRPAQSDPDHHLLASPDHLCPARDLFWTLAFYPWVSAF
jgi:hypothetical protein